MKNERVMGITGTVIRSAPFFVFGLCAVAAMAYTIEWHPKISRHRGRPPFAVLVHPGTLNVTAGATAHFHIVIRRHRFHGRIRLTMVPTNSGLPGGARTTGRRKRITLRVRGRHGLLTVRTGTSDKPGRYSVRLRATGGRWHGYLTVILTIAKPEPASLTIAGSFGSLWPGSSRALDLALSNPNGQAVSVGRLTVVVKQVTAPHATTALPCSPTDFSTIQFAGPYPLIVPAHATVHLSDLQVPAAHRPRVTMLDRPVNQDGCQGATVTLSYNGSAAGG